MATTMTPAELATELDSNGREVRKFLRSITPKDEQPGKGARWAIPAGKRELTKLSKQFADWRRVQLEERAKRAQEAVQELEDETPEA